MFLTIFHPHKLMKSHFYGYKTHIAINEERLITAAGVTTGEKHDGKQLQQLVEQSKLNGVEVKTVIGDGAYSEKEYLEYAEKNEIEVVAKLSKTVTHGCGKNKEHFEFNKDAEMYVCKAGHMAIRKAIQGSKCNKTGSNTQAEIYYFDTDKCKLCEHREGCYKAGSKTKSFSVNIKTETHLK